MAQNNPALKLAIFSRRVRQKQIAKRAGMSSPTLSKIINGRLPASDEQKIRIAKALRMPVSELFAEDADGVSA